MRRARNSGFSIATLIVFAAVISILAAASIPAFQMRAQREREEELIFRGEEYVRAIQKYQRRYNVYPPSIDALVSTDGVRFIRRQYKDPITGEDFRIISVNPDGSVVGSNTLNLSAGAPLNLGNNSSGQRSGSGANLIGNTGTGGSVGTGGTGGLLGAGTSGALGSVTGPRQGTNLGTAGTAGLPGAAASAFLGGNQRGAPGIPGAGGIGAPAPNTGNRGAPGTSPFGPQGTTTPTAASSGIIGVGANKPEESIKIYNTHQKYSEWEFIALNGANQQAGQGGPNNNPQTQNPGQNPQGGPGAGPRGQPNTFNPFAPGAPAPGINTPQLGNGTQQRGR